MRHYEYYNPMMFLAGEALQSLARAGFPWRFLTLLKKAFLTLLLAWMVFPFSAPAQAADPVPPMFTVITSPDPQTRMMALVLTLQARKKGAETRVLLCGPAGRMALRDEPSPLLKPNDKSPKMLLQKLVTGGAKVDVCALFLPNAGLDASALIEGIGSARPPEIADVILDPSVRLFNF